MKKKTLFLGGGIVAIIVIVVSSILILNFINDKKIDKLYTAAINFYDDGDYDNAIISYEQILKIKNIELAHTRIDALKDEKAKVAVITDLFNGFKRINDNIDSATNTATIKQLLQSVKKQTDDFNNLETGSGSDVDKFIDSFNSRPTYQLFLKDYVTGDVIQDTNTAIIISSERLLVRSITDDFLKKAELPKNIILE